MVLPGHCHRRACGEGTACLLVEPEWLEAALAAGDNLQIAVEEPAPGHGHGNAGRVADILQRVCVEDDQVGKLTGLDAAKLAIEAERAGGIDRRGAQRFMIAHAAALEGPD